MARVQEALAVLEAGAGQQDLADVDRVVGEAALVELDEADLADGSGGLLLADRAAVVVPAEAAGADRDGAGGYDDDLVAELADAEDVAGDGGELGGAELAVAGQGARADLDLA